MLRFSGSQGLSGSEVDLTVPSSLQYCTQDDARKSTVTGLSDAVNPNGIGATCHLIAVQHCVLRTLVRTATVHRCYRQRANLSHPVRGVPRPPDSGEASKSRNSNGEAVTRIPCAVTRCAQPDTANCAAVRRRADLSPLSPRRRTTKKSARSDKIKNQTLEFYLRIMHTRILSVAGQGSWATCGPCAPWSQFRGCDLRTKDRRESRGPRREWARVGPPQLRSLCRTRNRNPTDACA